MGTDEFREALVRCFPDWLDRCLGSSSGCAPVEIGEETIVLTWTEDRTPEPHIVEMLEKLTSRKVEFKYVDSTQAQKAVSVNADAYALVESYSRLDTLSEIIGKGFVDTGTIAYYVCAYIVLMCLRANGSIEAHRGEHPVWADVTNNWGRGNGQAQPECPDDAAEEDEVWSLTLKADGILWLPLGITQSNLQTLLEWLAAHEAMNICGREVRAAGIPEDLEKADSFILSFHAA